MRAHLILILTISLVGCSDAIQPVSGPTAQAESNATQRTADDPVSEPDAPGTQQPTAELDLSIPKLPLRPVVWRKDWTPPEPPAGRQKAQIWQSMADRLKAAGLYEDAEESYRKAMSEDPTWAFPPYQLACNYELWGKHDRAVASFEKSMELGFDNFPTALADDELGKIRDRPDFNATLAKIRERYVTASASRVGQPIAVRPTEDAPATGWPIMLLLHGYGDTNVSYLDNAEAWAELGYLAVAVPGTIPAHNNRFMWDQDSIEPTHAALQAVVNSPQLNKLIDRERVFLLGFSQGALHAMLLTAEHPDRYAGVVALSPGGSQAKQLFTPQLDREHPARVFFIHGTEEPHAVIVRIWSPSCAVAQWKFASRTHEGGHHFPENWEAMRSEVAEFLAE